MRQNLVLVLGLQGRFGEAETLARQDQSPAEAAATIAYLKRSVSQQNSWEMLKGGGKPKPKAAARAVETADPARLKRHAGDRRPKKAGNHGSGPFSHSGSTAESRC